MVTQGRELSVVILGAERTGKTALVKRYVHSTFSQDYDFDPSFDTDCKQVSLDGLIYTLTLLPAEPSGEHHLCQTGQAFILLYAINNRKSFHHVRHQHNQLKVAKGDSLLSFPVFLVGTKSDLVAERQVSLEESRQLAIDLRCQKLFETSARTHTVQINDLFTKLLRQSLTLQPGLLLPRPPMTPLSSTTSPMSSPNDDSPRRGSVLERLKFGSLKRRASVASLARKKSTSFSESIATLSSARQSRDNVRSTSYGQSNTHNDANTNSYTRNYSSATIPRKSVSTSPWKLDVNTSAWRDTVKWPTEIIPEEDLRAN